MQNPVLLFSPPLDSRVALIERSTQSSPPFLTSLENEACRLSSDVTSHAALDKIKMAFSGWWLIKLCGFKEENSRKDN